MSYEKALNELKKATMAAYLAKAPRAQRADDSISKSFDNDYGKALSVANKHHPNMLTPGFEKDPAKLRAAELNMKANADLRDTFKRKANNRIKGIARAGRLLAKEDAVNEANHTHQVVYTVPGEGKQKQYYHVTADDEAHAREQLMDAEPKAKIHKVEPIAKNEEVVNELKTSTLASVATKRYAQAQAALKAKDFGGYVKNKAKSMKAADATTPKSGWSSEDDKKNEEVVVPTVSAQEKYRQIKEAKVKKAVKKDYASGKGMRGYGDPPKDLVHYANEPTGPFSTRASDKAKGK
jgi:nitrogen regulatory protein PII